MPVDQNSLIMERLKDISLESRKLKELNVTSKKDIEVNKENVEDSSNSSMETPQDTTASTEKGITEEESESFAGESSSCSIRKYNSPLDHMTQNDVVRLVSLDRSTVSF